MIRGLNRVEAGRRGYVAGLRTAYARGREAAVTKRLRRSENPYRKAEHRKSWDDGWKAGEAERGAS